MLLLILCFFVSWSCSSLCNDYFRQSLLFLPGDNKNWHLSWNVNRGYGWDQDMDFYLYYPINSGLNQNISVWFLEVWLSTCSLPVWVLETCGPVLPSCSLWNPAGAIWAFHRFNSLSFLHSGGPYHHCSWLSGSYTEQFLPTFLCGCRLIFESFDPALTALFWGVRRNQRLSPWARPWGTE